MSNPNEFTNDAPSPFAPTALDTEVNDFIASAQKEFAIAESEPEGGESAPGVAPVELVPETPAGGPPPNAEVPAVEPGERGLERVVARELELRERESKVSGAEKEIETLRSRLRELEPRALSPELLDKIKLSPADGLRALGLDPDEVIRTALMEKIGDKADPAMREMMERTRLQKEMLALKAQVNEAERRQAAQAYYNQVANGAREFTGKHEEIGKNAPTVATVAKTNPDRVYQEIMEEITRDAAVRSRQEPGGDVISYAEASKRVEARWSAMKKLLVGESAGAPVQSASTSIPETKQNEANSPAKSPPTTIKPPEKPLAPWLRTSKNEEDAIRVAIAEWTRAESHK